MASKKCGTCGKDTEGIEPREGEYARGHLDRCPECGQPGAPASAFEDEKPRKKAKK